MAGVLETGSITVEIAHRQVDDIVAVSEGKLRTAIRALTFEQGLVVEGAGAAAAAAVLCRRVADDRPGARIVAGAIRTQHQHPQLLDVLREPTAGAPARGKSCRTLLGAGRGKPNARRPGRAGRVAAGAVLTRRGQILR